MALNYAALLTSALGFLTAALMVSPPAPRLREPGDSKPTLPRADFLKVAGAGLHNFVADYFWILTIQQTGGATTERDYRDIYYFADLVTDIDPKFRAVYRSAAVIIPFNLGRETWVNTKESSDITRKGLKAYPDDAQLNLLLAHNLIFYDRDYTAAADVMTHLSKLPDARPHWAQLATRLYAASGEFETSMALAQTMADNATDEESREFYTRRMKEIVLEKILQDLEMQAMRYQQQFARLPKSVEELVVAGFLSAIPEDPLGGQIFLDDIGRGRSTAMKYRLEVIDERIKNEREEVVDKPKRDLHPHE